MGAELLVAAVALVVVAAVAWPLVRERRDGEEAVGGVGARDPALQDDIDQSLRAIREIEFDHQAGNLSEADYAELDRAERGRAAELLRRRDAREG